MKKIYEYILPIAIFIIITLFIDAIVLHKSMMEIDWIFYAIFFITFVITSCLSKKIKNKH